MSDQIPTPAPEPEAGVIAKDVIAAAGAIGPYIPYPLVAPIVALVAKYGPGVIDKLEALFSKPQITWDNLRTIFSDLQPYSAFGIPDVVSHPPGEPLPAFAPTSPTPAAQL